MNKLNLDSALIQHHLDSLFIHYNVKKEEFNLLSLKLEKDFDFRHSFYKHFHAELDSNKMLDTLFVFYTKLQSDSLIKK